MSICDFAGIFDVFLRYAAGLKKDELYSKILYSYYEFNGKLDIAAEYTANKVKSRKKVLEREGRQFYAESDNYTVLYDDLNERVLPYESLSKREYAEIVHCIKELSYTDQEILYLRINCGLKYNEIADSLHIPNAAARKRMQTARENLEKLLEKESIYHE